MIYFSVESSRNSEQWVAHLKACKNTWKHTLLSEDELYFIFGDVSEEDSFNDNFFSINGIKTEKDEIFYPVVDDYRKTVFKTLLNMRDFLTTEHTFYVRTHTGSYLNLKLMNDLCKTLQTTNLYAGNILYYPHGPDYPKQNQIAYATGSCFVLTRDIVKLILDTVLQHKDTILQAPDDVFFGYLINKVLNIPILNLPKTDIHDKLMFDPKTPHYYFTEFTNKHKKEHNYRVDLYYEIHNNFFKI